MALENLNRWKFESSTNKDVHKFVELRGVLSDFLIGNGSKIYPKGILQNIFLPVESLVTFSLNWKFPSIAHIEYKSEINGVPIAITTDRFAPHADDPKQAKIKVQIGEPDCAVHYYIAQKFKDSSIVYTKDIYDNQKRVKNGDISSKESQDLTNLLLDLK
ncbi:MAG TPA: hypothetical protein VKC54_04455 [Patescibacteria group bacterium]|nr:hypothetical protein [Patescibacteria group bacterium]